MVLLNAGYRFVLRQSLDAQNSLFRLGREILHEDFSDVTPETFQLGFFALFTVNLMILFTITYSLGFH
jgi:hypothetical protein